MENKISLITFVWLNILCRNDSISYYVYPSRLNHVTWWIVERERTKQVLLPVGVAGDDLEFAIVDLVTANGVAPLCSVLAPEYS